MSKLLPKTEVGKVGNHRLELEKVIRIRAFPERTEIVGEGGTYHLPAGARDVHVLAPGLTRPPSRRPVAFFLRLPYPSRCSVVEEREGRYTIVISSPATSQEKDGEAEACTLPPLASP